MTGFCFVNVIVDVNNANVQEVKPKALPGPEFEPLLALIGVLRSPLNTGTNYD